MDALQALLSRISPARLAPDEPDPVRIEQILAAGLRAADHGRLRPWRFLVVRGEARHRFGELLADGLKSRNPEAGAELLEAERNKALRNGITREEKIRRQENANIDAMMRIHRRIDETVEDPATADALKLGKSESIIVPAARLFLRAGKKDQAEELAADLDNQLQTQSRAYARIIDGNVALLNRRRATAIDAFRDAIKLADFWMGRFDMGVTYVQVGLWVEALSELDACEKRRGEATAIFLDDSPTLRYQATLPYWLARAQEGLAQEAAARNNYRAFLSIRGADAPDDPLVADARRRAGS